MTMRESREQQHTHHPTFKNSFSPQTQKSKKKFQMNGEDFFSSAQWIEELSIGDNNNDSDEEDLVEVVSPLLAPFSLPVSPLNIGEAIATTVKEEVPITLLDFAPRHASPGESVILCMSSSKISKLRVWFDQETKRSEARRITPQTWKCEIPKDLVRKKTGEMSCVVTMRIYWVTSALRGFPKGRYDFTDRYDMTIRFPRERVDATITTTSSRTVLSRKRSRQDFKEADEDSTISLRKIHVDKNDSSRKRAISPPIVQRVERYRKSFATMIDEEDVELDTNKLSAEADRLFEDAFRFFTTATSKRKEERKLFVNEAQRVDQTGLNLLHLMCLYVKFCFSLSLFF